MRGRSRTAGDDPATTNLEFVPITVVISDSNQMSCELLAGALKRARTLKVVKCATTGAEVRDAITSYSPDIALISTELADGPYSGFKVLRQLPTTAILKTRYVMMMNRLEPELVIDAFRAGARGVFHRSAPLNHLLKCITVVHGGQVWASSEEIKHLLQALQTAMPFRYVDTRGQTLLSRREQQVVPLVAEGLTNKEIAKKLSLSEHTVKNHLFRIYEKLGISSRVELILFAVTHRDNAA